MSGCVVDCRPVKLEAGEPLRRAVEGRYLILGDNRLLSFDVNALPDAVATWAIMMYHGREVYVEKAKEIVRVTRGLGQKIETLF